MFLAHYLSPILLNLTYSCPASHPSLPSCSSDLLIKVAVVLHHGVYPRHSTASLPLLWYSSRLSWHTALKAYSASGDYECLKVPSHDLKPVKCQEQWTEVMNNLPVLNATDSSVGGCVLMGFGAGYTHGGVASLSAEEMSYSIHPSCSQSHKTTNAPNTFH